MGLVEPRRGRPRGDGSLHEGVGHSVLGSDADERPPAAIPCRKIQLVLSLQPLEVLELDQNHKLILDQMKRNSLPDILKPLQDLRF